MVKNMCQSTTWCTKPKHVNHMNSEQKNSLRYAYTPELERDILYEDSHFEIDSDDEADLEQSKLPYLTN